MACATSRAAVAHAAGGDGGTVSLDQPAYTAHENQGELRSRSSAPAISARPSMSVTGSSARTPSPGSTSPRSTTPTSPSAGPGQLHVPTSDHRPGDERHPGARAGLPLRRLARQPGSQQQLADHDPPRRSARGARPANPLGVAAPVNGNLLAGAKLYVNPTSPAAAAQQQLSQLESRLGGAAGPDRRDRPGRTASTCGTWAQTSRVRSPTTWRAPSCSSPAPR